jgi:hypothetical protein
MGTKYNVYKIDSKNGYHGFSLVSAESVEEANKIITKEIEEDVNNYSNMWGYETVSECDIVEHTYSEVKGIILRGIHYCG